ncbi:MAG: lipopolysaccharide heptosyltransferase II [Acidobacteriia bacterium]|nr:lipopolysaccharide heptosyltransferase II [Terriglobia bacterium]
MALNPSAVSRVMIRATNWLGDAVMSLPALRAIRHAFPKARLCVVSRPWVADLYARESSIDKVIRYEGRGARALREFAVKLRAERFDCAILLQNAFEAALMAWIANIPMRIGYNRDGRGWLLTGPVTVPEPGDIPRHERFYYLELLRRAGLIQGHEYAQRGIAEIRLEGADQAAAAGARRISRLGLGDVVGISPGAAYGNAKRWLPERFAEAGARICREIGAEALVFGSPSEKDLCAQVAAGIGTKGLEVRNLAGETSLGEFIELAAGCRLFLTNDSGAMHIASALGVPTVTIFGATDDTTTGPAGPWARVVREHAECSPCLLRQCPIDHRCMTRVSVDRVAAAALDLWKESAAHWTHEARS